MEQCAGSISKVLIVAHIFVWPLIRFLGCQGFVYSHTTKQGISQEKYSSSPKKICVVNFTRIIIKTTNNTYS